MANSSTVWQKTAVLFTHVYNTLMTTLFSTAGGNATAYNTWLAIPNLYASITPTSSSRKVMLLIKAVSYPGAIPIYRIKRNGTVIFTVTTPGSKNAASFTNVDFGTPLEATAVYIDSPAATTNQEYTVEQTPTSTGTTTYYTNRDSTGAYGFVSSIIAIEI